MPKIIFPIHLLDLPSELYVELDASYKKVLLTFVLSKSRTRSGLSRLLGVPRSNIGNWFENAIPLGVLKALYQKIPELTLQFPPTLLEKKVTKLRGMTNHFGIANPRLPIMLTPKLASIIGHFLGDGGIKKRDITPMYCNIYADVGEVFLQDLNAVFGEVEYRKKTQDRLYYLLFPTSLGLILVKSLGLHAGKKSKEKNLKVPNYVRDGNQQILAAFLRAIYDDECNISVRNKGIRIEMANEQIVRDIREMLITIGISCNPIHEQRHRFSLEWCFSISSQKNLLLFQRLIGCEILEKRTLLQQLLDSYRTPVAFVSVVPSARKKIFYKLKHSDFNLPYNTFNQWRKGTRALPVGMFLQLLSKTGKRLKRSEVCFKNRNRGEVFNYKTLHFSKIEELCNLSGCFA